MDYSESKIDKRILKGLSEMGFVTMTPIQELAIPVLLEGKDIIGQAQTGTGKTAAFGIPMIENLRPKSGAVQALVLCPTRELAVQAAEELSKMAKHVPGVRIAAVYGGQDIEKQFRLLKGKVSIVVGTPGRVMDHMRRGTLKLDQLHMLVLDEADEMLNMGFRDDMETICRALPEDRQTALFSATMPDEILEITRLYQKNALHIRVQQEELTVPQIRQSYYAVKGKEKDTALCRLLDFLSPEKALIFCNTKKKVDQLTLQLKRRGYSAEALHGDLAQHQRDRVMDLFRNGNLKLLLATDVAARGIDVEQVDLVLNYDLPQLTEFYVHRIGRTGRAGRSGKAVSLVTPRESRRIREIENYCGCRIRKQELPSAVRALTVKADRMVSEAIEYCDGKDLTPYMKIVWKRCQAEGLDPLEAAAAFLRRNLGEIESAQTQNAEEVKAHEAEEKVRAAKAKAREKKEKTRERDSYEKSAEEKRNGKPSRDGGKKRKGGKASGKKNKSKRAGRKNGTESIAKQAGTKERAGYRYVAWEHEAEPVQKKNKGSKESRKEKHHGKRAKRRAKN